MTREEIRQERARLAAEIMYLELKCPHEFYEIEKQEEVYGWLSEVWYNCFCHDCYKTWTVFENSKEFKQVKEKYDSTNI